MTTRSMAAGQFGRFGGSTCDITPPDDNSSSAFRPAADGIGSLRRFGPEALPARSAGCQSLVVALPVIMLHEFLDGLPQGSFSEQDDPLQARFLDGSDEAFRVGIQV